MPGGNRRSFAAISKRNGISDESERNWYWWKMGPEARKNWLTIGRDRERRLDELKNMFDQMSPEVKQQQLEKANGKWNRYQKKLRKYSQRKKRFERKYAEDYSALESAIDISESDTDLTTQEHLNANESDDDEIQVIETVTQVKTGNADPYDSYHESDEYHELVSDEEHGGFYDLDELGEERNSVEVKPITNEEKLRNLGNQVDLVSTVHHTTLLQTTPQHRPQTSKLTNKMPQRSYEEQKMIDKKSVNTPKRNLKTADVNQNKKQFHLYRIMKNGNRISFTSALKSRGIMDEDVRNWYWWRVGPDARRNWMVLGNASRQQRLNILQNTFNHMAPEIRHRQLTKAKEKQKCYLRRLNVNRTRYNFGRGERDSDIDFSESDDEETLNMPLKQYFKSSETVSENNNDDIPVVKVSTVNDKENKTDKNDQQEILLSDDDAGIQREEKSEQRQAEAKGQKSRIPHKDPSPSIFKYLISTPNRSTNIQTETSLNKRKQGGNSSEARLSKSYRTSTFTPKRKSAPGKLGIGTFDQGQSKIDEFFVRRNTTDTNNDEPILVSEDDTETHVEEKSVGQTTNCHPSVSNSLITPPNRQKDNPPAQTSSNNQNWCGIQSETKREKSLGISHFTPKRKSAPNKFCMPEEQKDQTKLFQFFAGKRRQGL
ncbi:hypothetical protein Ddc_11731 [Ditylenchus destructor]|nr:hypothetical protein Ddc_11731 [Ditylenchus destructor]